MAALPRAPRRGLRVRAPARGLGRGQAARGHRGHHAPARRGVGALEPRLRPARHALRARERALGGDAPAHASRARPSSTRATRSGSATAPEGSACTTAPGATASATRCSGTARPPAASRPARPGCRRWTRSGRTSRRSATTRDRCSRSYATCSRPGGCSATELELLDAAAGVVAYRRGDHAIAVNTTLEERPAPASGDVVLETRPGALRRRHARPELGRHNDGIWGVGKGVEPTQMAEIKLDHVTKQYGDGYEAVRDMTSTSRTASS